MSALLAQEREVLKRKIGKMSRNKRPVERTVKNLKESYNKALESGSYNFILNKKELTIIEEYFLLKTERPSGRNFSLRTCDS